ncbi:MAG TPA: SGNH/GDSL hydrolase family protein [Alicycliphilus sp.]|nr:SGNH/GDSL hydrolase family protein [Alicycliphilus sp.]
MAANWMRRSFVATACATAALLAACGSSTIDSAIRPTRFIAFGDAMADVGQKGSSYTVNDGSINNWTQQLASRYSLTLKPVSGGGTSYAQGNARVNTTPDAAGNASTPTVKQQVDQFLANPQFRPDDVILVSAGASDIIAGMAAVQAGTMTSDQYIATLVQAGKDLAVQIGRLSDAGATHIVVSGSYDLERSPWAKALGQQALIHQASQAFNDELKLGMKDMGKTVLYIDLAYYVNIFEANPGGNGFNNSQDPVCTSVDAGPGIGIGAGQVNSALCTPATIVAGADYNRYVFADKVYLAPYAHRLFGDYAYNALHRRW